MRKTTQGQPPAVKTHTPSEKSRFPAGTSEEVRAFLLNWRANNITDNIEDAEMSFCTGTVAPHCATKVRCGDDPNWLPVLFFEVRKEYYYESEDDSFCEWNGRKYIPVIIWGSKDTATAEPVDYEGSTSFELRYGEA